MSKTPMNTHKIALALAFTLMTTIAHAGDSNEAAIGVIADPMNNHVRIGDEYACPSNQRWHVPAKKCVFAQLLESSSTPRWSEQRYIECAKGYSGFIIQRRTASYVTVKYGWIVPPNNRVVISHETTTTDPGTWYIDKEVCTPETPPPPPPPPPPPSKGSGVTKTTVSGNLVCSSSSSYWNMNSAVSEADKKAIVSAYRANPHNSGRCPEQGINGWTGWSFWLGQTQSLGISEVTKQIRDSRVAKSEQDAIIKTICTDAINRVYGVGTWTSYKFLGGNSCQVIF